MTMDNLTPLSQTAEAALPSLLARRQSAVPLRPTRWAATVTPVTGTYASSFSATRCLPRTAFEDRQSHAIEARFVPILAVQAPGASMVSNSSLTRGRFLLESPPNTKCHNDSHKRERLGVPESKKVRAASIFAKRADRSAKQEGFSDSCLDATSCEEQLLNITGLSRG